MAVCGTCKEASAAARGALARLSVSLGTPSWLPYVQPVRQGALVTDTHDLSKRNADFAASAFRADLRINPYGNMMVIGCVDPRVDPAHVLGLSNGEAAVIRNVGG